MQVPVQSNNSDSPPAVSGIEPPVRVLNTGNPNLEPQNSEPLRKTRKIFAGHHIISRGIRFALDHSNGDLAFLSHAHSDHTAGLKRHKILLASQATLDLAGITAQIPDIPHAKLIDAGHILGSRQLVVDGDGERVVYTGDFSLKANIFGFKAEIPLCDRLIMEATYGDPQFHFPSNEDVHDAISAWIENNRSSNLIFGSYELGKSQEIIQILNGAGIAPVVSQKTEDFCSIYGKYGFSLKRVVVGTSDAEEIMSKPFAAVVPMRLATRNFAERIKTAFNRPTLCAVVTGWALKYKFNAHATFPLSDHADFPDLVSYIEQTGARKVEFFTGDGSKVLDSIKNRVLLNNM